MQQKEENNRQRYGRLADQLKAVWDVTFGGQYEVLKQDTLLSVQAASVQSGATEEEIHAAVESGELPAFDSQEFGTVLLKRQVRQWRSPEVEIDMLTLEPFIQLEDLMHLYEAPLGTLGWDQTDLVRLASSGLLMHWQHPTTYVLHIEEASFISLMEHTLATRRKQDSYQQDAPPSRDVTAPEGWLPKAG
ncbi:MAG TPA: hypothetical protein DCE41_24200 [Cytophagales bacterium]|nr:hypothetical protein [Cytophagales bacterium]HAA23303.1 hypothetical protein [Cytophagales bacterium]HAP60408.1 hypothetical protein [Cytophagales bacterium]